ncbi:MAG TPA: tRNA (adenosine(37)-N6)-threonylcarbamoyltransferase complex ATPase subunit type 1 TsaE [Actinocrinis sp.]|nr:tRNA (adenosine(37)-N6)-threonylcarbamoyltransferase complex ATPase subunit type 1 TsaE [Actinocrinis sp.]
MTDPPAPVAAVPGAPAPGTELITRLRSRSAEQTRQCAREFGWRLAAGDLVILSGELGAGKTTFTQGLAEGLGVRGPITSPTFVIARVHPSLTGGAPLVHVDAYRLGSLAELDDLDLDAAVEDSVTVVEWGEGKAEVLAQVHYTVHLARALADDAAEVGDEAGDEADDEAEFLDPRLITITRVG